MVEADGKLRCLNPSISAAEMENITKDPKKHNFASESKDLNTQVYHREVFRLQTSLDKIKL